MTEILSDDERSTLRTLIWVGDDMAAIAEVERIVLSRLAAMGGELHTVVEWILDDGHLSTETLAQLRAAYESAPRLPAPSEGAESAEWLMQRCEEYQSRAHEAERAHRAAPAPDSGASMAQDAMRLALEWLENEQRAADEDCGAPECDECQSVTRPRQRIVDALRAALGVG
jgi:hypothetical protein